MIYSLPFELCKCGQIIIIKYSFGHFRKLRINYIYYEPSAPIPKQHSHDTDYMQWWSRVRFISLYRIHEVTLSKSIVQWPTALIMVLFMGITYLEQDPHDQCLVLTDRYWSHTCTECKLSTFFMRSVLKKIQTSLITCKPFMAGESCTSCVLTLGNHGAATRHRHGPPG